ncbi:MAG: cell division ATP-binding protein FtsE [Succinivibrionaceae bacterium]|nr:cell division ATP-binding protein FtsE [Succinivibrionaceae bacterium]
MIRFEQVSKSYLGGFQAIQQVSFSIAKGEMVYLRGHSGAGKSSLLKLISSIEQPSLGRIFFNGHDITRLGRDQIPEFRRQIGMIFQDYRLINSRTVYENVALPLEIEGYCSADIAKRTNAALDYVGLIDKSRYYPLTLSGGEQQRVGIARAIVHSPKILLADEPTGNLDPEMSAEILKLFTVFNRSGATVLLATHDSNLFNLKPCRQLVLKRGRLIGDYPAPDKGTGKNV